MVLSIQILAKCSLHLSTSLLVIDIGRVYVNQPHGLFGVELIYRRPPDIVTWHKKIYFDLDLKGSKCEKVPFFASDL
jgi:hypothetical protein